MKQELFPKYSQSMSAPKVTQKMLAKSLGISQGVVSKVLNGDLVKVSPECAQRILAAAEDLEYKKPRPSRTLQVGVILKSSDFLPHSMAMLAGIQEEALKSAFIPVQHIVDANGRVPHLGTMSGWISMANIVKDQIDAMKETAPLVMLHPLGCVPMALIWWMLTQQQE